MRACGKLLDCHWISVFFVFPIVWGHAVYVHFFVFVFGFFLAIFLDPFVAIYLPSLL